MNVRGLELEGDWTPAEVAELRAALEPLPDAWLARNASLRAIIRRDALKNAPSNAPGHSMYSPESASIVLFDKGVYHGEQIDREQFRRSIYHELAHTVLRNDRGLIRAWSSATSGDGFVDEYAKTAPEEDFADSFSEFFLHRAKMEEAVPLKFRFLADLVDQASPKEKVAMAFVEGFADELVKVAKMPTSLLQRAMGKMPGVAKGVGLAGAAGGGAYLVGKKKGEHQGIEEGLEGLDEGMRRAYIAGVQRGAVAMRDHMAQASGEAK